MEDVVQVLGVGGDLLERSPGGLDGSEVLFLLIFAAARAEQAVLAQDALNGHVTEGQFPLALQALGAESGELAAQGDDPLGQLAGDPVRTRARGAGKSLQALETLGLMTAEPLAHGGDGGLEGASGGFDAVLTSVTDQAESIVKRVFHGTNHIEVGDGSRHRPGILGRPAAALLSPQQGGHLSSPLLTQTLQADRGNTMYPSNPTRE